MILFSRYGGSERVYRLEFVSNQDFTDSEFFKWKETMMTQGYTLPTTDEVQRKLKDLQDAHQYKFKDDDVDNVSDTVRGFELTIEITWPKVTKLFSCSAELEIYSAHKC